MATAWNQLPVSAFTTLRGVDTPVLDALIERTFIPEWEIGLRLVAALILGGALGFDRELKNRPAGLRTHMLTALAAAIFAIVTIELGEAARLSGAHSDPVRAIEAVTAGVAFLAAGTIIQSRGRVHGLTTGAGMWLAGAVGVASGFGFMTIALLATVLALIILSGLDRLAKKINPDTNDPEVESKPAE
jgi:putative Mg2+ transporter-C (MgtC) family protein